MLITPEDAARIATLSRLRVGDDKLEIFARQMSDILGYMETLNRLDTSEVEPMYSPVDLPTVLRPDVVRQDFSRAEILANAPEEDGKYFIVPKIV